MVWAPCRLQGCQEALILLRLWPSLTIAVRRAAMRGGIVGKSSVIFSSVIFGLGSILIMSSVSAAQAAELQIIAGGGIAGPLNVIASEFERASGHRIVIRYGTTPELIRMATSGGPFDLGVVPQDVWKDAAARAQVAPGPVPDVARVGIGVAVRAGAPKPDISTPEGLSSRRCSRRRLSPRSRRAPPAPSFPAYTRVLASPRR